MHTYLLAVGKLRPYYRAACDDYLQRLRRYGPITEREVREAGRAATPELCRREEATRLLAALPPQVVIIALERAGSSWTSAELARRLDGWRTAASDLALVIGGGFGLAPELLRKARYRWSLGPLTFPHELARVVVLEQWYRAWTILRGEPYHKSGEK
ncbi:MAG TPA: 23S rRNA (pseudouridine(1915)-N(3))-methyltransferase RlmH [Gemmatimonadales bacterium]|jgi:23S rRNA (pseudouridine1915-N3)-methyltransferase|nr:23S rRNA (pseudouridine(1915)-N(3))-methyltransferase RlmH [Gemmatimonadales bacterium]